jgi:putative transposon-encoded protein
VLKASSVAFPLSLAYTCTLIRTPLALMSKKMLGEEFEFTVQKCGNSGHVRLSSKWIGKRIRIRIEEIERAANHKTKAKWPST